MATYDLSQNLVTLTNLIPDGDMELSSWSGGVYDTTTKKYGSRSQHFTASGTHVQSISIPTLPIVGHKYYGRHYLKTNGNVTADDCRFEWYAGDGVGLNYVFGYNRGDHADWEMESAIKEVTAVNGSSYVCRSFTVNASSDVWADGLMIIDLTSAFGAGNEPTQEWCDAHIPFFVGTTYLPTNLPETFKIGDVLNVPYTGHRISMMLPKKNIKFECWGAQGGAGNNASAIGGNGGYSVGTIKLPKTIEGHLYSGGQGATYATSTTLAGGFNGGGNCVSSNQSYGGGSGGGASDVRVGTDSLYSRLITAGGGGGGGYTAAYVGGAGGGTSGVAGIGSSSAAATASGGTQIAGGACSGTYGGTNGASGAFGTGGAGGYGSSKATGGAGGGGWYGGAGGKSGYSVNCTPGGGGSGYVYTESTASSYPSGGFLDSTLYLRLAQTIAGSSSFTSPTGTSETGHSGDGYIRITIVSSKQQEYNVGDILDFDYTGSVQTKTLPKGKYKLEVWGAQGGYRSSTTYGGKGGYSVGTLTLTEKQTTLYIYSGGSGNTGGTAGGFNGGGKRNTYVGGGGASDIRVGQNSLYARVIVAGGGGSDGATNKNGMYGGGTTGGSASQSYGSGGYGGTQTGISSTSWQTTTVPTSTTTQAGAYAGFGFGGNGIYYASGYGGAGGGGWYGGSGSYPDGSGDDDRGGGGGSGYVYTSSTASNYPSGCLLNSSYYLADAQTIAGSASFTDPNGSTVTGHSGDGYVRITILEVEPQSNFNFRVRVNGDWKETISGFVKVSGEWKEIIMASTKVDGWWTGTDYTYGTLEETPWKWISKASEQGIAQNLWSVGDTKSIMLNGTVGTLALNNETLYAYILGFDHNPTYEESGITFGTFKTAATGGVDVCLVDSSYLSNLSDGTKAFNINHCGSSSSPYNTNYGGWKGCDLRYDILGSTNVAPSGYGATATTSRVGYDPSSYNIITNPVSDTLLSVFPQSLRVVMKPNTKYTDNTGNSSNVLANVTTSIDYLWLLSEYEIFGTRTYANQYEQNYQAQYQYYIDGASKVKYKHSSTASTAYWWERSPYYSAAYTFCNVFNSGSALNTTSRFSIGLAPAFLV